MDDIIPLLNDDDPLGTEDLATFLPPEEVPLAYESFQKKERGTIKVVLCPTKD